MNAKNTTQIQINNTKSQLATICKIHVTCAILRTIIIALLLLNFIRQAQFKGTLNLKSQQDKFSKRNLQTTMIIQNFSISVLTVNPIINKPSQYQLSFQASQNLSTNNFLLIGLPIEIKLSTTLSCYVNTVFSMCSRLTITNEVNITQLPSGFDSRDIKIRFDSLINPKKTSPMQIQIKIFVFEMGSTGNAITSKQQTITLENIFKVSQSLTATVSSTSDVTYQKAVGMQFMLMLSIGLQIGDRITVQCLSLDGQDYVNFNTDSGAICLIDNSYIGCFLYQEAGIAKINVTINIPIIASVQSNLTILNIFQNPRTTQSTIAFILSTSQNQYPIQIIASSISPIISTPALLQSLQIQRTSTRNADPSDYIFKLNHFSGFQPSSISSLHIKFPSEVALNYAYCIACSIDPNTGVVIFVIPVASNPNLLNSPTGIFEVIVSNAINPESSKPFSGFELQTMKNYQYSYSKTTSSVQFSNNEASNFENVTGVYSSYQYGTDNTFSITFSLHPLANSLSLILPASFTYNNPLQCNNAVGFIPSCSFSPNNDGTITVQVNSISPTPLIKSFSIQGPFINPIQQVFDHATLISFTNDGYIIEDKNFDIWKVRCTMPCQSCEQSNLGNCLSCYQNTAISLFLFLDSTNKRCRTQCFENQYQSLALLQCIDCDSSCRQCKTGVNQCSRCFNDTFLYLGNKTCMQDCPDTFYNNNIDWICQPCVSPCITCSSVNQCKTCQVNKYFYNNKCVQQCPQNLTIPDLPNQRCLPCDPKCYTCSIAQDNCTSCSGNNFFYNNQCISECQSPLLALNGECVSDCHASCLTCDTVANNCTSCDPIGNLYFFGFGMNWRCLNNCPQNYFEEQVTIDGAPTKICSECASLNINCTNCLSDNNCIQCNPSYILYNSTICLSQILPGYVNISGVAVACVSTCSQCSITPSNCSACNLNIIPKRYHFNNLCIQESQCTQNSTHYISQQNGNLCLRCKNNCHLCQSEIICLSCLIDFFFYSTNNSCLLASQCPQYFYPNETTKKCQQCKDPCEKCNSQDQCLTCDTDYFYFPTTKECFLAAQCPSRHYPQPYISDPSKIATCQPCQDPCRQCTASPTVCSSCLNSYYLFSENSSCLEICPQNYVIDYFSQTCTNCTLPCIVCSQTECYKCSESGQKLYNNRCVTECPANFYAGILPSDQILNQNGTQCLPCPTKCSTCLSQTYCIICNAQYWKLSLGECVQQCPNTHAVLDRINRSCKKCSMVNCSECYPNDQCYKCQIPSIYYNFSCIQECPLGYEYSNVTQTCALIYQPPQQNNTNEVPASNPIQKVPLVIKQLSSPVPFMFTICHVIVLLMAGTIKIIKREALYFAISAGLLGLFQTAIYSLSIFIHFLYIATNFFQYKQALLQPFTLVMMSCLLWLLLLNIIAFIISLVILNQSTDNMYKIWYRHAIWYRLILVFFLHIISLFNFRVQHFLYSKLSYPNVKLDSILKLRYISVISGLSILSVIGFQISWVKFIIDQQQNRLFWIDVAITGVINSIVTLLAIKRDQDFFQETNYNFQQDQKDNGLNDSLKNKKLPMHKRIMGADEFFTRGLKAAEDQDNYYEKLSRHRQSSDDSLVSGRSQNNSHMVMLTRSPSIRFSQRSLLKPYPSQIQSQVSQLDISSNYSPAKLKGYQRQQALEKNRQISLQCSILTSGNQVSDIQESQENYVMLCSVDKRVSKMLKNSQQNSQLNVVSLSGSQIANMGSLYSNQEQNYYEKNQSNLARIQIKQFEDQAQHEKKVSNTQQNKQKQAEYYNQNEIYSQSWLKQALQQNQNLIESRKMQSVGKNVHIKDNSRNQQLSFNADNVHSKAVQMHNQKDEKVQASQESKINKEMHGKQTKQLRQHQKILDLQIPFARGIKKQDKHSLFKTSKQLKQDKNMKQAEIIECTKKQQNQSLQQVNQDQNYSSGLSNNIGSASEFYSDRYGSNQAYAGSHSLSDEGEQEKTQSNNQSVNTKVLGKSLNQSLENQKQIVNQSSVRQNNSRLSSISKNLNDSKNNNSQINKESFVQLNKSIKSLHDAINQNQSIYNQFENILEQSDDQDQVIHYQLQKEQSLAHSKIYGQQKIVKQQYQNSRKNPNNSESKLFVRSKFESEQNVSNVNQSPDYSLKSSMFNQNILNEERTPPKFEKNESIIQFSEQMQIIQDDSPNQKNIKRKIVMEEQGANQFRIKTIKQKKPYLKRPNQQHINQLLVDDRRYRKLYKRQRQIQVQQRNAQRIKQDFQQIESQAYSQFKKSNFIYKSKQVSKSLKKESSQRTLTRNNTLQQIYLRKLTPEKNKNLNKQTFSFAEF